MLALFCIPSLLCRPANALISVIAVSHCPFPTKQYAGLAFLESHLACRVILRSIPIGKLPVPSRSRTKRPRTKMPCRLYSRLNMHATSFKTAQSPRGWMRGPDSKQAYRIQPVSGYSFSLANCHAYRHQHTTQRKVDELAAPLTSPVHYHRTLHREQSPTRPPTL